jgi:RES domain-containing protein
MLEYFVHLDADDSPEDLVLAIAEIPENLKQEKIEAARLPVNWRDPGAPPELTHFGDEFAKRGTDCLLWVPSVLAPSENNCLMNPAHAEYKKIVVRDLEPLKYDARMFHKKRHRH